MRVLFLHSNVNDYLDEMLFHGLRTLLGADCVEFPRFDNQYKTVTDEMRSSLRGNAFSLYGLLDDLAELPERREMWRTELASYDLVVISGIWRLWPYLRYLAAKLPWQRIAVVDGEDTPALFPYALRLRRKPLAYACLGLRCLYFKRELIGDGFVYGRDYKLPVGFRPQPLHWNVLPISFAIPAEKISSPEPDESGRDKMFPAHIVDQEVASSLREAFYSPLGSDLYSFSKEEDYYRDLRRSHFGITTKRAGWDCLRHYELAANGCILCFRDLDLKPSKCAPAGLDASNCVIYHSAADLMKQVNAMGARERAALREAGRRWLMQNTTKARAAKFIEDCSVFRTERV